MSCCKINLLLLLSSSLLCPSSLLVSEVRVRVPRVTGAGQQVGSSTSEPEQEVRTRVAAGADKVRKVAPLVLCSVKQVV